MLYANETINRKVLINIRPMNAMSITHNLIISALFRCGFR